MDSINEGVDWYMQGTYDGDVTGGCMGRVVLADGCGAVDWIIWNGWIRVQEFLGDWGWR